MELAQKLTEGLERLFAEGRVEVRENGARLGAMEGFGYQVRQQGDLVLLHLWGSERNLVRRILRVAAEEAGLLALETMRLGRSRPDRLEFVAADNFPRTPAEVIRDAFQTRFRDLLTQQFPDEQIVSLTNKADLKHSLSGNYARAILERDSRTWAVLGTAPGESAATHDALLTFGLLWLDRTRESPRSKSVAGLRLFFPADAGRVTKHRLQALSRSTTVELYEYSVDTWRARLVDPQDTGNWETWLAPRREAEAILAEARPAVEHIQSLAPGIMEAEWIPGTREVALRFRGLIFARWTRAGVFYGAGDPQQPLTADRQADFERLVKDLETYRSPVSTATKHALYRAQSERWLETMVAGDLGRIDARLDTRFLYKQVPALSAGDRSVMDLIGVTRSGRLAVVELKVAEDPHLALQAVDYWLRVRWHHAQQDFSRYGYFPGIILDTRPPLLYLVAPAIRFHSATDIVLRYLSDEIEICRVGVSEHWRRGLKVVLRHG